VKLITSLETLLNFTGPSGIKMKIEAKILDHMGFDMRVADAARVSFAKKAEGFTDEQNHKLIRYLSKEGHIAPFGHNYLLFHVKAPIFVSNQLVKHKFMRMSQISRRYISTDPEFYVPDEWRASADSVKQGSGGKAQSQFFPTQYLLQTNEEATQRYRKMLSQGICAEQARMHLPLNTFTEWWWSGSLDAFSDMANLRLKSDTQYETRLVAQQISDAVRPLFPVAWDALLNPDQMAALRKGV